jgi:hypothetical protein
MYITHTTRPDRDDLWSPFRHKELALAHAEASNAVEGVTCTAYEITPNDFADPTYFGDFFLMEVEG